MLFLHPPDTEQQLSAVLLAQILTVWQINDYQRIIGVKRLAHNNWYHHLSQSVSDKTIDNGIETSITILSPSRAKFPFFPI